MALSLKDAPQYQAGITLHALRGKRGGRVVYTMRPTLRMALDLLPKPDPTIPFPNNRPIVVRHARAFGDYWEKTPVAWGCPPGLISVRQDFASNAFTSAAQGPGNVEVGELIVPTDLGVVSEILDMQHRLYGWHLKYADLAERLRKEQDRLLTQESDPGATTDPGMIAAIEDSRRKVSAIRSTLERFNHETITVEVMVLSEREHRTLFAMIADKALAINAAQIADYDDTQTINKVAHALADNDPLLKGRVDWVRTSVADTARGSNPALISGDTLVNTIRPFATGSIVGRVSDARNEELQAESAQLLRWTMDFWEVMAAAFDALGSVLSGRQPPATSDGNQCSGREPS